MRAPTATPAKRHIHIPRTRSHDGGAGRHTHMQPRWWRTHEALRSLRFRAQPPTSAGPALPGASPCLKHACSHLPRARRPTSGRYTSHVHAACARRHNGGACWCKLLASPRWWMWPRGVARHNPIPPRMMLSLPPGMGGLSGRLPIFRSRGFAGGGGRRSHSGGALDRSHDGGATPLSESPSATSSSRPPSPSMIEPLTRRCKWPDGSSLRWPQAQTGGVGMPYRRMPNRSSGARYASDDVRGDQITCTLS